MKSPASDLGLSKINPKTQVMISEVCWPLALPHPTPLPLCVSFTPSRFFSSLLASRG